MRIDRRFITVVAVSLFWSLLVAFTFYRFAGPGRRSAKGEGERPLVVAAHPLPLGVMLNRSMLKMRQVPASMYPSGGFSRIEDLLDRPVISGIQAEEPVVEARLAARGSGLGLAPLIPTGMRAMSVRVNDVVGVAGFLLPGMRVDVLVTGRPPNHADTVTRTVLQNILVLSAGQTFQTDGKSQTINVPVVTLLVAPDDAEALTLANNEGRIQLVLRNSTDEQKPVTRGRQTVELFGSGAPAPPVAAATKPRKPAPAVPSAAAPVRTEPVPVAPVRVAEKPAPEPVMVIRGSAKTLEPGLPKGENR